jgi:glycerol-3-phosphate dehydrogenase
MSLAPRLDRQARLREIGRGEQWDVLVIGGGATGLGTAVEAASRGYRTLLLERNDYAQGTSSRSTKLVHGGVRYLEQFNLTLVFDALRERGYMLRNAPHLVHKLNFVVPMYSYGGFAYYGPGLKAYELLSGKLSFGKSDILSIKETKERLPTVRSEGLKGGILYRDGQFDDARYALALMRTLEDLGGTALNYAAVTGLLKRDGRIEGVKVHESDSGEEFEVRARVVINATGAFTQELLQMDHGEEAPTLALSQGSHFVLPKSFLQSTDALMIPKTDDGRVLFAIPWHEEVLVGTTDEAVPKSSINPEAMPKEKEFLAEHIHKYLSRTIVKSDVLSMWSGLRPLVRKGNAATAKLSRDHQVTISPSGLVSVMGGKWTTYRKMGEDTINRAAEASGLAAVPSRTVTLKLHGWKSEAAPEVSESDRVYGSDLASVIALGDADPTLNELLHPQLPYRKREVVWAAREEQALTTEDVLARRTRALFLNAEAAIAVADEVSRMLAKELQRGESLRVRDLQKFRDVAEGYVYKG